MSTLLKLTPVNIATWGLGGFYLSLMPTLVVTTSGHASPLIAGTVVATLTLSATISILAFRRWQPERAVFISTLTLIGGVVVTLFGINLHLVSLLYLGTVIAGQGFGLIFSSVLKMVMQRAEPHQRAGLFAAFLIISYLAFSLPAIAAGMTIPHLGLLRTADIYGIAIVVLALLSLLAIRTSLPTSSAETP